MLDNGPSVPFYEYKRQDGTTFEIMQKMVDPPLECDPETGLPVTRVFHPIAVHFKGSGFYNTDYGTARRKREMDKSASDGADKHDAKMADKRAEKATSSDTKSEAKKPDTKKKTSDKKS